MPNPKKRKILYVITKSNWGGAQRYVYDLATHLTRKNLNFDVVVALGGRGPLAQRLHEAGVRIITLENLERDVRLLKDARAFLNLYHIIDHEKPDIVHLNSSKAAGLGALASRLCGVPLIVFTSHGWPYHEDRGSIVRAVLWFLSWCTVMLTHRTITVSEHGNRRSPVTLSSREIVTIHNGIAPIVFLNRTSARRSLVPESENNDELWIGSVGELHKNKGYLYSIRACALLAEKKIPFRYIIIGGGEDHSLLENLIRMHGLEKQIILAGQRQDAPELLKAFDLFLLPSIKEGLPYTILEAGLAGLPTVASSVGGVPEVIKDGETGFLTATKSPEAIARAVERFIENKDLRQTIGQQLRAHVENSFTVDKMAQETLKVYDSPLQ